MELCLKQTIEWVKQLGTSGDDEVKSIELDSNNNLLVTGYTGGGLNGNTHQGNNDTVVIKFDSSLGQIKKVHVEKSFSKSNRHVKFFISKNPGFINGEELVCVTEISVDNLKRYAKDLVKSSYDYYRKKLEK